MSSRDAALRGRLNVIFLEELDEHLERLEQGLGAVSVGLPEVSQDAVRELFRSAHSLKGAAAAVGATVISSLCHRLEETLGHVRDGAVEVDQDLLDQMLRTVDLIAEAGGELRRSGGDPTSRSAPGASAPRRPAGEQPGETPPVTSGPEPLRDGSVRITSGRLDALLAEAGDLITATYRSELLVAECLEVSESLTQEADLWQRDRDVLHRALAGMLQENPRVREVMERIDARTRRTAAELDRLARSAGSHQASLRGLATGFAESVREARMVPFTEATVGLARVVRDHCAEQGKEARLVVDAAEVEVDKQLVSTLHDVLGHAVRNAVAHGIEPPAERARAGKPPAGAITVQAVLVTDGIRVTVSDDGQGVDDERVRRQATALGLSSNGGGELNLTETLFHPGLSTATEVTGGSGRGVGLDAVRVAVEAAGGSVYFDSRPGEGSALRVNVPLTLATLRVLIVRMGEDTAAVPTSAIRALVKATAAGARIDGREVVEVDDTVVPVVPLSEVLGWGPGAVADQDPTGMLLDGVDGSVVLVADELVAEREVVLMAAPRRLAGMAMLLGTAQLEDGSAVPVLSPSACARTALTGTTRTAELTSEQSSQEARVLLVEDTVTTRELERSILVEAGYDVVVAVDGQQAWEMLHARDFDAVVSDVNMPRMDGIALCRAVRASRQHSNLPLILVTSLHSDADRRRGLDAGADAYLTKAGFDRADLLAALERVL